MVSGPTDAIASARFRSDAKREFKIPPLGSPGLSQDFSTFDAVDFIKLCFVHRLQRRGEGSGPEAGPEGQAGEPFLRTVSLCASDEGIEQAAERADLQLILHPLAHDGARAVGHDGVAMFEPPHR